MVRFSCLLVLGLCLGGVGCAESGATQQPAKSQTAPQRATKHQETFDGLVQPSNATILRAPENTFRVGGWNSSGGWIKLVNLVEDGKEVKQNDVVGWFEFPGARALDYVRDMLSNAQADQERTSLTIKDQLTRLSSDQLKLALDAKRAKIDTQKEGLIAQRDLERLIIEAQQADFEHQAQQRRLGAYTRSAQSERAFIDRRLQEGKSNMARFDMYKDRFNVRAPHDGVVRHSFHPRRGRKIQKGDGMPSGMEFVTVAKNADLEMVFYIPEDRYPLTKSQRRFMVQSPSSSKTYEVEVTSVERFPQELGFLKKDDNLPTAREKMYVIHAKFLTSPEDLSAGLEVKVRLP